MHATMITYIILAFYVSTSDNSHAHVILQCRLSTRDNSHTIMMMHINIHATMVKHMNNIHTTMG
jgi:hypothetical protein